MSYCCVLLLKTNKAYPQNLSHTISSLLYSLELSQHTHTHLIIFVTTIHSSYTHTITVQWSVVEPSTPSGKSGKSGVHTGPHPKTPLPPQWEQHPPPVSWGSEWHSESGKSGKSGSTTTESSWWSSPPPHPMPHEVGWSSAKSNKESWWSSPPPQQQEEGSWLQWGVSKATKHHKSSKSKSAKSMLWHGSGSGGWWMSSDGKYCLCFVICSHDMYFSFLCI